jgi:hypothetical protein
MNTVKLSLLILFITAVTNISFAGEANDEGTGTTAESECDYIPGVETT